EEQFLASMHVEGFEDFRQADAHVIRVLPVDGGRVTDMAKSEWQLDQFSLERTPLILSILDRVSLTRLWQISNLQTIYFPQAGGSLRYGASHIELSDWRFANASIAINLEGMIERPGQHIEIKGYIVPLSLLEKTLASIPLFGWLLTDNGQQPILVTAFTLDGDYDNPNVTFNPFETLLPGRLRNPVRDWFQAQPDTSQ
ncbi:MAG: AsmA-like C-terminal domain-containing protein, partial [Pseudomonadota bacterium]